MVRCGRQPEWLSPIMHAPYLSEPLQQLFAAICMHIYCLEMHEDFLCLTLAVSHH